jgi:hypothetical protein
MISITYDSPATKENSSYFAAVEKDCIRMYGKEKGARLAHRFWEIRLSPDPFLEAERFRIIHGLA